MYDSDIIIVGAGPAGLSAAARARRVRTYNLLPASVTILSNWEPGGLADWWKVRVTGDGWSYPKGELIKKLMLDVEDYNIPVENGIVEEIFRDEEHLILRTKDKEYRCLAVVICTGMRLSWNEREFFPEKIYGTLKGYRYMEDYFTRLCENNSGKKIIFVGTMYTDTTTSLFETINKGRMDYICLEDNGKNILGYRATKDKITVITSKEEVTGDMIHIDFESYMQHNLSTPKLDEHSGFLNIDRKYQFAPGIFAAGDVTGPPFSIAKAVGEGTSAGLEAYDHIHRIKFGKPAPLFAFYPNKREGSLTRFEIPELKGTYRPKLLGKYVEKEGNLIFREISLKTQEQTIPLLKACNGINTISQLHQKFSKELVNDTITRLIHGKDLTLEV